MPRGQDNCLATNFETIGTSAVSGATRAAAYVSRIRDAEAIGP
jgi:hypothetical protein